jgi:Putative peptidoglycan binding domain
MARSNVTNGSQGSDAFDAQCALNGFHIASLVDGNSGLIGAPLREDSQFGAHSVDVLNDFKRQRGLPEDGIADAATWDELEPFVPTDPPLPDADLTFGVPSARVIQGFRPGGHAGVDLSRIGSGDGTVNDPRRGMPIFISIKDVISREELLAVQRHDGGVGVVIPGDSDAHLVTAIVIPQPWPKPGGGVSDDAYGGVLGIAARYQYQDDDGNPRIFTVYIEYEHLITPEFGPKNGDGTFASLAAYGPTGKGIGFCSRMFNRNGLPPADLDAIVPVGFLGATQTPHVHVQSRFKDGAWEYIFNDGALVDPSLAVNPVHVIIVET